MLTPAKLAQFVGNPDAYGVQNEVAEGVPAWSVVRAPVTESLLQAHLEGTVTVGAYTLAAKDKARTLVFDLDSYDNPEELLPDAVRLRAALTDLGIQRTSTGIEFSGGKGYHVWMLLNTLVPAADLRRLGRHVLGLTGIKCEVFPKADRASDLGNFVKLPGGFHRRAGQWSKFVTPDPVAVGPATFNKVLAALPEEPKVRASDYDGPEALTCVNHMVKGPPEGFRNNGLFHLAVMARKAGWDEETVELVVRTAYGRMDQTDFEEHELVALLESSKDSGPLCGTFEGSEHHCGEACILARSPGLYTKSKRLSFAQPGEKVVVEVADRYGKTLVLDHPDVKSGGKVTVK